MRNAFACLQTLTGFLKDGLEARRMRQDQSLKVVVILWGQQNRCCFSISSDDHWAMRLCLIHVGAQAGLNVCQGCDLHILSSGSSKRCLKYLSGELRKSRVT